MPLRKKVFFTQTEARELVSEYTQPSDSNHILRIEAHQEISEGTNDLIAPIEYHLYDNWSAPDLPKIHVVVTAYYNNSRKPGNRFRLDTRPHVLKNNFSAVLKWDPKLIVQALTNVEKSIAEYINNQFIFSTTKDWEIQYYGLIRELYRKCS